LIFLQPGYLQPENLSLERFMKNVTIGIIGLGIGKWHLESYRKVAGTEVTALCDMNSEVLKKTGQENGVRRLYMDYKDLLADRSIDAVSVCVPNSLHRKVATEALSAGKHVLCEKPLANSVAEAQKILQMSRKSKRTFMVAMKIRYWPETSYVHSLFEKGKFGFVYYGYTHYLRPLGGIPARPTFIYKKFSGGGALIDNGVHLLDTNWYLMGCPKPRTAFGVTSMRLVKAGIGFGMPAPKAKKLGCDVEEFGAGLIRFENGSSIYLDNAWASFVPADGVWNLRILGDKGGATVWPLSITYAKGNGVADATPDLAKIGFKAPTQFDHFIDCIRKDRSPLSTAEQGVTLMKMLGALYRSNKTGKAVEIE
jgi:predicted dehydrogenase